MKSQTPTEDIRTMPNTFIEIKRIDFCNGTKFDSIDVYRTIRASQLDRFRHLVEYFASRKLGKEITVLVTYQETEINKSNIVTPYFETMLPTNP